MIWDRVQCKQSINTVYISSDVKQHSHAAVAAETAKRLFSSQTRLMFLRGDIKNSVNHTDFAFIN